MEGLSQIMADNTYTICKRLLGVCSGVETIHDWDTGNNTLPGADMWFPRDEYVPRYRGLRPRSANTDNPGRNKHSISEI